MYRVVEGDKDAVVFLNKDELYGDAQTVGQIRAMVPSPAVRHARVMPDCHFGQGCCIGFTSELTDCIVPNHLGGDIGCGITVYAADARLLKKIHKHPDKFLTAIEQAVPVGTASHATPGNVTPVFIAAQRMAVDFAVAYKTKFGIALTDFIPTYDEAWFAALLHRTGMDARTVLRQVGTLGAGNHFMEISASPDVLTPDSSSGEPVAYLSVHAGSRALGQAVCQFHQNIITQGNKPDWDGYVKASKKVDRHCKDATARAALDRDLREAHLQSTHPKFLTGAEAYRYYFDMIFAQCYAQHNRWTMLRLMTTAFGVDWDEARILESVHNFIDFGDLVWRKGAVAAPQDAWVIIALNMQEGILLGRGLGNPEWNNSAPHGAGRRVPRNEAKHHCTLKQFKTAMRDVYSHSVNEHTLDEAPIMYKNSALIQARSTPTCTIVAHLRPVLNVKGY